MRRKVIGTATPGSASFRACFSSIFIFIFLGSRRFDRAWKRGTRASLKLRFMGLVSEGANTFLLAPHGGQKFSLRLHGAQVAQ